MKIKTIEEHKADIKKDHMYLLQQEEFYDIINELAEARHSMQVLEMEKEHYKKGKEICDIDGCSSEICKWTKDLCHIHTASMFN